MSGSVAIRDAEPSDASAVALLLGELGYPAVEEAAVRQMEQLRGQPGSSLLVADAGGDVVGLAALHVMHVLEHAQPVGVMIALAVRSDQRRGGVGGLLSRAVEDEARRQGCCLIVLGSAERRADAHAFYESQGYERTGRRYAKLLATSPTC
jgi:GNAT superfamily N-acetyltransferase